MAEALATLSLFCNVLAVAGFARKILKSGYEIHKATSGAISEHEALEKCAEELYAKNKALQESLAENQSGKQDPDDAAINKLAMECNGEAHKLINELRRIATKRSTSRFESIRSALKASWRQNDIDALATRMKSYKDQMDSRLIASISLKQKFMVAQTVDGFEQVLTRNDEMSVVLQQIQQGQQQVAEDQNNHYQVLVNVMVKLHEELMQAVNGKPAFPLARQEDAPALELHVDSNVAKTDANKETLLQLMEQGQTRQVKELLFSKPTLAVQTLDHSETTALHVAAASGNVELVRALIRRGANVNAQDEDNLTPLHVAVKADQAACVRSLLQKGAKKDAVDEWNKRPLHYAKPLSEMAWILEHGPEINATDANGITCLMQFVYRRDARVVISLLEQGANPSEHAKDKKADTPLIAAVVQDSIEIINILLSANADINAPSSRNDSPLAIAANHGHYHIVKLLVSHGAELNGRNDLQFTPLLEACWHGNDDIGAFLVEAGADVELAMNGGSCAIHIAATKGCARIVQAILAKNPLYANAPNNKSGTPLFEASYHGQETTVRLLLEHGADVRWRPKDGLTPVAVAAASRGHSNVIQILVDEGHADLELCDAAGKTALIQAIKMNHPETVRKLLQLKADADNAELSNSRWTPLTFAIDKGYRDMVRMLLREGRANPNLRNGGTGATPLSEAVRRDQLDIVEDLLDHGANPDLVDVDFFLDGRRHYPPICTAAMNANRGGLGILTLLVEKGGADLSLSNARHQWTALHEVACHGPIAAVRYLLSKGADAEAVAIDDTNGKPVTPLELALRERDRRGQIAPLLQEHLAAKRKTQQDRAKKDSRDEWQMLDDEREQGNTPAA